MTGNSKKGKGLRTTIPTHNLLAHSDDRSHRTGSTTMPSGLGEFRQSDATPYAEAEAKLTSWHGKRYMYGPRIGNIATFGLVPRLRQSAARRTKRLEDQKVYITVPPKIGRGKTGTEMLTKHLDVRNATSIRSKHWRRDGVVVVAALAALYGGALYEGGQLLFGSDTSSPANNPPQTNPSNNLAPQVPQGGFKFVKPSSYIETNHGYATLVNRPVESAILSGNPSESQYGPSNVPLSILTDAAQNT